MLSFRDNKEHTAFHTVMCGKESLYDWQREELLKYLGLNKKEDEFYDLI